MEVNVPNFTKTQVFYSGEGNAWLCIRRSVELRGKSGAEAARYLVVLLAGVVLGIGVSAVVYPSGIQAGDSQGAVATLPPEYSTVISRIPVLAVKGDDNTGVVTYATIELRPGKGRVLINTNPFVEPDTQFSAETAVKVASAYTKKSVKDKDVILTFEADTRLVGGPSAGAAMAVAAISAIENKTISSEVVMTGTIEEDGSIGQVGGVLEKAEAAAKNGVKVFLVPEGEAKLRYYEARTTERRLGGFVIQQVEYVPKTLDLAAYMEENYGMQVKEVSGIREAAEAFGL